MPSTLTNIGLRGTILVLGSVVLYGCGRTSDANRTPTKPVTAAKTQENAAPTGHFVSSADHGQPAPVTTIIDARPVALVDGDPVTWGDLRDSLTEAAGAQALREVALEMKLKQILNDSGKAIGETELADERRLFITALNPDPNVALRLLEELRNRQGLGTKRFEKLLWQNAALRMLVRDRVQVSEDAVQNMFTLIHGPKRQARLIVTPNLDAMAEVVHWLEDGASFADIAVNTSTDTSAARGGLLEPMSSVDPNYPAAIRDELFKLKPAEVSAPILIDNGYALLRLEREIQADDVELSAVRPEMERLVRINQERIAMDQLARSLLNGATVTVIDPVLNESWNRARGKK